MKRSKESILTFTFLLSCLFLIISYLPDWLKYHHILWLSGNAQFMMLIPVILLLAGMCACLLQRKKLLLWMSLGSLAAWIAALIPLSFLSFFLYKSYFTNYHSGAWFDHVINHAFVLPLLAALIMLFLWCSLIFLRCRTHAPIPWGKLQVFLVSLRALLTLVISVLLISTLFSCKKVWFAALSPGVTPEYTGAVLLPLIALAAIFTIVFISLEWRETQGFPLGELFAGISITWVPASILSHFIQYEPHHNISSQISMNLAFDTVQPAFWDTLDMAVAAWILYLILFLLRQIPLSLNKKD